MTWQLYFTCITFVLFFVVMKVTRLKEWKSKEILNSETVFAQAVSVVIAVVVAVAVVIAFTYVTIATGRVNNLNAFRLHFLKHWLLFQLMLLLKSSCCHIFGSCCCCCCCNYCFKKRHLDYLCCCCWFSCCWPGAVSSSCWEH